MDAIEPMRPRLLSNLTQDISLPRIGAAVRLEVRARHLPRIGRLHEAQRIEGERRHHPVQIRFALRWERRTVTRRSHGAADSTHLVTSSSPLRPNVSRPAFLSHAQACDRAHLYS